jgi:hypothetical protein
MGYNKIIKTNLLDTYQSFDTYHLISFDMYQIIDTYHLITINMSTTFVFPIT